MLLAALYAAILPSAANAVSFGADDRQSVSREAGSPYDAIGLLAHRSRSGTYAAGAATLVAPCYILTAYHVAGGGEKIDSGTSGTFYIGEGSKGPGLDDFDHFELSSKARAVAWGHYTSLPDHLGSATPADLDQKNGWEDWALLRLDTCLGDEEYGRGYMRLKAIGTRDVVRQGAKLPAKTLGFPIDKDSSKLWLDPECEIIGQIYSSGWEHDCITLPGNSGGPMLVKDGKSGEDRIVAINVSHIGIEGIEVDQSDRLFLSADDPTYYEYLSIAVPVSSFIDKVARYLPPDPEIDAFIKTKTDQHYEKGDEATAIADIDFALERSPHDFNLILLRGLWKASKGDIEGALADWSSIEGDPALGSRALYHRARLLLEFGDAKDQSEVETGFTKLIEDFPDNVELHHYRGFGRARREDWQGAIDDFTEVLRQRPESAVVFNDRGDAYRSMRDFDRAKDDYDQAVKLAPDWPEAWRDRGYLEHVLAEYDKAESDFRHALAIDANDAEALNGLGLVALAKGMGLEASVEFAKAIQALPESGVYFANRGAAAWVSGEFGAAIEDFTRSISLDPKEPYIRLFEFLALARIGKRSLAEERLKSYLAEEDDQEWPRAIIDYYLGKGSAEAVEKGARDAPEEKKDGYEFDRDFYLGEWALIRGDKAGAIRRLQAVLDTELREYLEYDLARADLSSLGVRISD